jgi:hypothetical protein
MYEEPQVFEGVQDADRYGSVVRDGRHSDPVLLELPGSQHHRTLTLQLE